MKKKTDDKNNDQNIAFSNQNISHSEAPTSDVLINNVNRVCMTVERNNLNQIKTLFNDKKIMLNNIFLQRTNKEMYLHV